MHGLAMTKRQIEDECRRLAPDFRVGPEVVNGRECIAARCTFGGEDVLVAVPLGSWGRATVESTVLNNMLASLRRRAAKN